MDISPHDKMSATTYSSLREKRHTVYIQMRFAVADYKTWREFFDSNDGFRRAGGWTGSGQVLRDVADPNTVTLVMEWQDSERAKAFLNDPALAERMKASGVTGAPMVRTICTLA